MFTDFVQVKDNMAQKVAAIYEEIGSELCCNDSKNIVANLIQMETERVNIYIGDIVSKTRAVVIEVLKKQGYPEYLTAGAWSKILRKVGMPEIQLCSIQQFREATASGFSDLQHVEGKSSKCVEQLKPLEFKRNISVGVAAVGGTAVVAALIIPGWEALPVAMLCTGGIVLVGGSVSAILTQSQIDTKRNKLEKEKSHTQSFANQVLDVSFAKKLARLQAKRNIEVISQWIDAIEKATVQMAVSGSV